MRFQLLQLDITFFVLNLFIISPSSPLGLAVGGLNYKKIRNFHATNVPTMASPPKTLAFILGDFLHPLQALPPGHFQDVCPALQACPHFSDDGH